MSTAHNHADMLPRGTLVIASSLVLFALAATTLVRVTGTPPSASPAALRAEGKIELVATRDLRFLDRADGSVLIEDTKTGGTAAVIEAGQETGFIRGVMRGLARERRSHGFGNEAPFTLSAWRDGELSLTDTATGRSIELTAFGSTNRAAFAALLPGAAPQPGPKLARADRP